MLKKYKYGAFTLIELLVVIVIIGILAALVIFALRSATVRAKEARTKNNIRSVQTAIEVYLSDDLPTSAICSGTGWCDVNITAIRDANNNQLLTSTPRDTKNEIIKVKFSGSKYAIRGSTGQPDNTCWWAGTAGNNLGDARSTTNCNAIPL